MKSSTQLGRWAVLAILGIAAAEVLIMISPFAGFLYSAVGFEPFLALFSRSSLTAWLDGFFLNHAVVTHSAWLEWQRTIGQYVLSIGLWGFLISAIQVYGNKITGRGVAKGFLYRYVRHPQYLSLGVAGLGLLTIWPRFLLLGVWITMLFLYAGLARFEEGRMEERFAEGYRRFAAGRGRFFPGSPMHRLFEKTLGRVRPRLLGWLGAYGACLIAGFSLAFALHAYTRSNASTLPLPARNTLVVSAWPQPEAWMEGVFEDALAGSGVPKALQESPGEGPAIVTILPPRYRMTNMFYKAPSEPSRSGLSFLWMGRIAAGFMAPVRGVTLPNDSMGIDPDTTAEPVQLVFSRAEKAYKKNFSLEEAFDPGVRVKPFLVVDVIPGTGEVTQVLRPLPQNAWGPNVVMPIL